MNVQAFRPDDNSSRRIAESRLAQSAGRAPRSAPTTIQPPRKALINGDPYGNRTRVSAVKGPRPRPLDEGATCRSAWASLRSEAGIRRWLRNGQPPFRHEKSAGRKFADPLLNRPRRHPPDAVRRQDGGPNRRSSRGPLSTGAGRAARREWPGPDRIPPGGRRWS